MRFRNRREDQQNDQQRRVPENTERVAREDPFSILVEMLVQGDPSQAIYTQEAAGQQGFVNSDTLPTESKDYYFNCKEILEAAGVKFGEVVPGDPLFQFVELPVGWKKVATEHAMWSDLVDEKGRKRAAIFYKAAFYDRRASFNVTPRYGIVFDYGRLDQEKVGVANVTDGDTVIHTTEPISVAGDAKDYEVSNKATDVARHWLDEHYPDWKNPAAYWD